MKLLISLLAFLLCAPTLADAPTSALPAVPLLARASHKPPARLLIGFWVAKNGQPVDDVYQPVHLKATATKQPVQVVSEKHSPAVSSAPVAINDPNADLRFTNATGKQGEWKDDAGNVVDAATQTALNRL